MGRKLQCQTQQRDGVQPATSELSGCRFAWTTGRMDRGMTGRTDSGEASFLIPMSLFATEDLILSIKSKESSPMRNL